MEGRGLSLENPGGVRCLGARGSGGADWGRSAPPTGPTARFTTSGLRAGGEQPPAKIGAASSHAAPRRGPLSRGGDGGPSSTVRAVGVGAGERPGRSRTVKPTWRHRGLAPAELASASRRCSTRASTSESSGCRALIRPPKAPCAGRGLARLTDALGAPVRCNPLSPVRSILPPPKFAPTVTSQLSPRPAEGGSDDPGTHHR